MENAQLHITAEPSAPNSANSIGQKLTARQRRVLEALFATYEWTTREAIDRIAGASNGPQIVLELRRKVTGYDGIEMRRAEVTDRDGKSCKPGRYRLTEQGRARARAALGGAA